jgi:DNA polymerase-3 subunit alpha
VHFVLQEKAKKNCCGKQTFYKRRIPNIQPRLCLFTEKPVEFTLPALPQHPLDDAIDQIELLGFSIGNPFALVNEDPLLYVAAGDLEKILANKLRY